jgi:hypothetical protein
VIAFVITVLSAGVGVISTIVVSRYFFRKAIAKNLSAYVQFAAPVFAGMDPDVRRELKVSYRGLSVEDLYEFQVAIVNDGERAIRDCIEPLSLWLPPEVGVLDAVVLRTHPSGRRVDVEVTEASGVVRIKFPFALLNKDEGFVIKLISRGRLRPRDARFRIVAEDLPPIIVCQPMPKVNSSSNRDAITAGVALFILSLLSFYGVLAFVKLKPADVHVLTVLKPIAQPPYAPLLVAWATACTLGAVISIFFIQTLWRRGRPRWRTGLPSHFWKRHDTAVYPYEMFIDAENDEEGKVEGDG